MAAIAWILGTFTVTLASASAAPDSPADPASEPGPTANPNLTADQGGEPPGDPRTEFTCMSDSTAGELFVHVESGVDVEPFDMYCLARCTGEYANPGLVPVAGPATPAEILREAPYVDPLKWCAFVATKACRNLGPDHKLAESCFGSRL